MLRTHTCGELRKDHATKSVQLAGWVDTVRTHGAKSFVDIRDKYGKTQLVLTDAPALRRETCITISGKVVLKPEANKALATGEIEVVVSKIQVLNESAVLPFDEETASEETRMKYRYLDLRSERMQRNIAYRSTVALAARNYLSAQGFTEIETPLLVRSTPEGARDFLVPSRLHEGQFYALPQSPQIYKQLLMISSFDKYFQLGRCMRDEDLRADRQPEHTQIDVEMSFVDQEDVFATGEGLMYAVVEKSLAKKLTIPFPRIPYRESIERYGIDKPDIRFALELVTLTDEVASCEFKVFSSAACVRALVAPKLFSNKEIKALTSYVAQFNAKGLAYLTCEAGKLTGPITKFLGDALLETIKEKTGAQDGQTIFFVADSQQVCNAALAQLRNKLGADLELYDPAQLAFCWVTDFPLFEWDADAKDGAGEFTAAHHMFTSPNAETMEFLESDKGKVIANCYDLVLNGVELSSGSIRIHDPAVQKRVMQAMGLDENMVKEQFGFFLEALKYGAPPHGGFGLGIDRLCAVLSGQHDIRDFIAFPKNKNMQSAMDGSPTGISCVQKKELGLK